MTDHHDPQHTLADLARKVEAVDAETRALATAALAELVESSGAHIERLHATLDERSPWIRYYLWKLRHLGDRAGVVVTLEGTSDRSVDGVALVARALLDRIADAVLALENALEDDDERVRRAALRGLGVLAPSVLSALRARGASDFEPGGDNGAGPCGSGGGSSGAPPGAQARGASARRVGTREVWSSR